MNARIIEKRALLNFLRDRSDKYDVFAPVKKERGIFFEPLDSEEDVAFDYSNSLKVPKEFFFPQKEVLFTFQARETETERPPSMAKPRVLFGIRPCDSKAILLLDKIFDQEDYKDPYYIEKRKNTVLIGLACTNPQSTCFCSSVGRGPFDKDGLDLFVVELDDSCYVEILAEKGKKLIGDDKNFKNIDNSVLQEIESLKKEAEAKITAKVPLEDFKEKLSGMFEDPLWDRIHEKCLGCAVCTYFCPTCHCFAFLDEKGRSNGERIRSWDSCMFPIFTLEASGHNPRVSNKERMRQRIMHKFNYFVENFREEACVGCGRCIRNCPVNMDIREIIGEIKR